MTEQKRYGLWLFGFFAISLLLLEISLSVDFSGSLLVTLLEIDMFSALITWYLVIGIISPRFLQPSDPLLTEESPIDNHVLKFPLWIKFLLPVLLLGELLLLMNLVNHSLPLNSVLIMTLYILGPLVFLLYRSWITTFLSVIWVWFPIEWDLIRDHLGNLKLTLVPLDALIGIFALLWPLIVHGRHIPWYNWNLKLDDVKLVGKISGILTLCIVPLGILVNFVTINPDNFLLATGMASPLSIIATFPSCRLNSFK